MLKKIDNGIKSHRWLAIIIIFNVLMRIPSLFEPYWYGDEAIYLTIGRALRNGVQLYSQIHDNKPPFLYVIAAIANGDLYWFKFITLIWSVITVIMFHKLAEKIIGYKKWALAATCLFAILTSTPKLEGNIVNAEIYFLLPAISVVYVLWNKNVSNVRVLVAGIILGLGAMFKIPVLFEAGIWPIIWILNGNKDWWKKTLILTSGMLMPIGVSVIYYWANDALKDYLTAAWLQNLPYLSSWKTGDGATGVYSLTGRLAILSVCLVPLIGFSKRIGREATVIGLWGTFALFAALLSGRPYPHYLLQITPVLAMLPIIIMTGKKSAKFTAGVGLTMFTGAVIIFKFYNYPVIKYYANFLSFISKQETRETYFSNFNQSLNDGYEVSELVIAGTKAFDHIFVWGDNPMIYALTKRSPVGKYTVKYHIKDFHAEAETMDVLEKTPPKYVISYGAEDELPGLRNWLEDIYKLQIIIGDAKVYRLSIGQAVKTL